MSSLMERIKADIVDAMRSGDKHRLLCLRGIHSEIKNVGINEKREIDDEVVTRAVARAVKQRRDANEQFDKGGRRDLVDQNLREVGWLQEYLPKQLGEAEIAELVRVAVAEAGASGKKDMGRVMQVLRPKTSGRADTALVARLVSRALSG